MHGLPLAAMEVFTLDGPNRCDFYIVIKPGTVVCICVTTLYCTAADLWVGRLLVSDLPDTYIRLNNKLSRVQQLDLTVHDIQITV